MDSNNIARPLRQLWLLVVVVATVSLIQLPAQAQTDQGRLVGVVTDADGAVVPGASIVAKNERTGEERSATSSESGSYVVSALRPSLYTITAGSAAMGVNREFRCRSVRCNTGCLHWIPLKRSEHQSHRYWRS
jgi:hypothetical protein